MIGAPAIASSHEICKRCRALFGASGVKQSSPLCPRCIAFNDMLDVLDALNKWRASVDVIGPREAADQLDALLQRGSETSARARSL